MQPHFREISVSIVLSLALLAGCEKHPQGGGHAESSHQPPDSHKEEAGHAHGESEGEHADEVRLTPDAETRYGVTVEPAQLWILRPTVLAPARIGFNTEAMAHVGSPLNGRVVEVKARLGDQVKAGQELLVIESPDLGEAQADFLLKRTAVSTSLPGVELAKASWERARGIYEQTRGLSLTEVEERESQYKTAIAGQQAAAAAFTAAESRLRLLGMADDRIAGLGESGKINPRFPVTAVIDGAVVQREATLGELVSPDRESLMVIADTRTLWVLADVPEAELAGLTIGNQAWITMGTRSHDASGEASARFEGRVSFVGPLIDPATRTAQVRIELPEKASESLTVKPGMFAQAEIVLNRGGPDPSPQVAVADEAIQTVEGGPAVFVPVAGEPGTFAKRAVSVGAAIGGRVPILSGLTEGERYVSKGTFILKAELGKGSAAHEH